MRQRTHPGTIFKNNFMENMNYDAASRKYDICPDKLQSFINCEIPCDEELATKISIRSCTTMGLWLNLQANYDMSKISPIGTLDDAEDPVEWLTMAQSMIEDRVIDKLLEENK